MKVLTYQVLVDEDSVQDSKGQIRSHMLNLECTGWIEDWWEKHPKPVPNDHS